jgi:hypothetical protein
MPSQDIDVSLFYDGAWRGVDSEVFTSERIKVTRGDGDEGAALRPAKVTLTFDNRTDAYRPSNPMSPLYGKAGRNTPLQVALDDTVRTTVEATSWTPDQPISTDYTRGRWAVDLEAYGLLGRISQWSDPLRSPFYRLNAGYASSVGYFPMEDPRGTKKLFTPTTGAVNEFLVNVAFESQQRPPGSEPLIDFPSGAFAIGYFQPVTSTTAGWQLSFCARFPDNPETGTFAEIFDWVLADGSAGSLNFIDTTLAISMVLADATVLINFVAVDVSGTDWTKWNMFRVKSTVSGGTVSVEVSWFTEGSTVFASFTPTYASSVTSSLKVWGHTGGTFTDGATFGHVLGLTGVTDELDSVDRVDAFMGYPGEPAGTRFLRLMGELDLNATLLGAEADTWPMGAQRSDTFLNLLREIARTEDALIFDSRDEIGLTMRGRRDRYEQTPVLELTFGVDVAPPFQETLDDLDTHNRIVVSQRDGGDYEAILSSGVMSVQPPPDGVGEYKQRVDVCTADEAADLPALAGWWLNRGTLARSRYATVTVNLGANPELADACNTLEIGDLITVAGYEPDPVPLIVIGFVDTIGWHNKRIVRSITFTTRPADLFLPGVYDTARYDSASTSTGAEYAPSATSIVFSTTNAGDVWATTGNGTPYDCVCAGEKFTVTAMGAVSGSGPYLQTATVTRGVNGVNKTLPSGEAIHAFTPGRYAL